MERVTMKQFKQFSNDLFLAFRAMDAHKPISACSENAWSLGIAAELRKRSYVAQAQKSYPDDKRSKCDLWIQFPNSETAWIEVKGAWKEWWFRKRGNPVTYKAWLTNPKKPHSAIWDLTKLNRLVPPHATYVGLLLVGLDSVGLTCPQTMYQLL